MPAYGYLIVLLLAGCSLRQLGDGVRPVDAGAEEAGCQAACATKEPFATDQNGLAALAANDRHVAWVAGDNLRACPSSGCSGAPKSLATENFNGYLALTQSGDGEIAYALGPSSSGGGVRRCELPACSGNYAVMYELGDVGDVAVDESETFLLDLGKRRIAYCQSFPGCGQSPKSVVTGAAVGGRIALDAVYVYWTSPAPENAVFRTLRSGGGAISTLASGQANPRALAVDGKHVYWANFDDGSLRFCSVADCSGTLRDLATHQGGPNALVSDGARVYWTNRASGTLMACAVDGCAEPELVASDIPDPVGLVLSGGQLFVASRAAKTIFRIAR